MFLLSFTKRPVCHTVSYATVRSRNIAPVFQLIMEALFNVCCEGSNVITGAMTFLEAGLVWTKGIFCGFCNAAKCEALEKLETDT